MTYTPYLSSSSERGSALLTVAIILFVISLAAAGGVAAWQRWRPPLDETPVTADDAADDDLVALFIVDELLDADTEELRRFLYEPLRQYYATQPERLLTVVVNPSDEEEHTTSVSLTVQPLAGGNEQTQTFFYDRGGEEHDGDFPPWEPSLLDNV